MADNGETILTTMELNISDVEAKIDKVDRLFRSLGTGTKSSVVALNDTLAQLTGSLRQVTAAASEAGSALQKSTGIKAASTKASLDAARAASQAAREDKLLAQAELDTAAAASKRAQAVTAANRAQAASQKEATAAVNAQLQAQQVAYREMQATLASFGKEINAAGGIQNWKSGAGSIYSVQEIAQMSALMEQYGTRVKGVTQDLEPMRNFWDVQVTKFQSHIVQWVAWSAIIGTTLAALEAVQQTVKETAEFQVQGVLLGVYQRSARDQGISVDKTGQTELLSASIQLAQTYGEKVNDVAQDIALWYKRTGDLNDAMALTNEALKFQLASGADLEDVYKTLTGLSVQSQGQKIGGIFGNQTFDMTKASSVLKEIYAAAVAAGGGMRTISEGEREIGGNANAASILLEALDKDNAALRSMGSTMTQSIAINAALIQSFGNTAGAASEASDRIGRIAGALAGLSKPGSLAEFAKAGIDVKALNAALDNHQNVLFAVLQLYDQITKSTSSTREQQEKFIETTLGGRRQFEALNAIYQAWKNNLDQIQQAMRDTGQEEAAVQAMHETLKNSIDRLNASWESLELLVGVGVVNALTNFVNVIPAVIAGVAELGNEINLVGKGMAELQSFQFKQGWNDLTTGINRFNNDNEGDYVIPRGKYNKGTGEYSFNGGYIKGNKLYSSGSVYGADIQSQVAQDYLRKLGNSIHVGSANLLDDLAGGGALSPYQQWMSQSYLSGTSSSSGIPDFIMKQRKLMQQFQQGAGNDEGGPFGGGVGGGKGKGQAKNYEVFAESIKNITGAEDDAIKATERHNTVLEANIQAFDKLMRAHGVTAQSVKALNDQYYVLDQSLLHERDQAQAEVATLEKATQQALKNASAFGANTEEHLHWVNVASQLSGQADTLKQKIADLTGKVDNNRASVAAAEKEYKNLIQSLNQTLSSAQSGLDKSVISYLGDSGQLTPQQVAEYERAAKAIDEMKKAQEEYNKTVAEHPGDQQVQALAQQILNARDATAQLDEATALYLEKLQTIKDSNWFKALETSLTDLSNQMTTSFMNAINGTDATNSQIAGLNQQIDLIQQQISYENEYYASIKNHSAEQDALHKTAIARYNEEIRKIKEKEQALKDAQAHPGFLKAFEQNFIKSMMDSVMKQLVSTTMSAFLKNPGELQAQAQIKQYIEQMRQNVQSFGQATTDHFETPTNNLIDAFNNFAPHMDNLTNALNTASSSNSSGFISGDQLPGFGLSLSDIWGGAQVPDFMSAVPLAGNPGGAGGGLFSGIASAVTGGGGSGGIGNLLVGLGGGGTALGLIGPALALGGIISSASSQGRGGGALAGSLAGVLGVGALGAGSLLGTGILGAIPGLLAAGPAGWAALLGGAVLGGTIGSLFGPHYNNAQNPDITEPGVFGPAAANFAGSGVGGAAPWMTNSTTNPQSWSEDPTLAKSLGNEGEMQYIAQFIQQNPTEAAKLLTPQEMQWFTGASSVTNFHQGNVTLNNGQSANWNDMFNAAQDATQAILNFKDAVNQTTQEALVSINMYGSVSGGLPFNWQLPGYAFPANNNSPVGSGNPGLTTNPTGPPTPQPPGGGDPGDPRIPVPPRQPPGNLPVRNRLLEYAQQPNSPSPASPSVNANLTTTIQLDGRVVARSVQAQTVRSNAGGYERVT